MIKISIITICYNSGKTVDRTIKSVLSQSYSNVEYIIVDGASTDTTLDIVKQYEPLFEGRMNWKSEPDHGIYDAMNKGKCMATGDIVGIVNSDDWLESDALAKVYQAYEKNGKSLNMIYTGGMIFHSANGTAQRLMQDIKALKRYAKVGDIASIRHPATFVPKQIYNKYGMFDTRMKVSADADFLLRYYKSGGVFSHK